MKTILNSGASLLVIVPTAAEAYWLPKNESQRLFLPLITSQEASDIDLKNEITYITVY